MQGSGTGRQVSVKTKPDTRHPTPDILSMSKIIVLMGAPGAGKGTQARLLQERLKLPQISTGDMFRALKEAQTPLAAEVRALMTAGKLVPDDVTIRVVRERTARDDCRG